ncbi:MAG: class I SAM-dependent methyltransferase [Pseudomonadales bacterium]
MDTVTKEKWDKAALSFDAMTGIGPERRWAPAKKELFANMQTGKILFLAAGTGQDFRFFPPGHDIIAIDISSEMLKRAAPRAQVYEGNIQLLETDVHDLPFAEDEFDQIFTSCTFCSVPEPIKGLAALHKILKPGGEIFMFEHTGSRVFPFNMMLNLMTPLSSRFGPEMNRDTVTNVEKAGFTLSSVNNIYLDVVKTICARKAGG